LDDRLLRGIGIIAACWHFSYGLWLFAAKWGITTGEAARRGFGYVCLALALVLVLQSGRAACTDFWRLRRTSL
jgi:hypothetical protein